MPGGAGDGLHIRLFPLQLEVVVYRVDIEDHVLVNNVALHTTKA